MRRHQNSCEEKIGAANKKKLGYQKNCCEGGEEEGPQFMKKVHPKTSCSPLKCSMHHRSHFHQPPKNRSLLTGSQVFMRQKFKGKSKRINSQLGKEMYFILLMIMKILRLLDVKKGPVAAAAYATYRTKWNIMIIILLLGYSSFDCSLFYLP